MAAFGVFRILATLIALAFSLRIEQHGVLATTLTYVMRPSEKACFYAQAQAGERLAFYFAVQSFGGSGIDYEVTGPSSRNKSTSNVNKSKSKNEPDVLASGTQERLAEFVLTAQNAGEHALCFSNPKSSYYKKTIDFEITTENERQPRGVAPAVEEALETVDEMRELVQNVSRSLRGIERLQRHLRIRGQRDHQTVSSTQRRLFWFGWGEAALVVAAGCAVVFHLELLLAAPPKQRRSSSHNQL
ncbi:emp24/gp25L/p24 family/GOLD-domain-containing protein [Phlyctochytrium arcticum]|nr:emp24/gp25L/p24 family/GOLD-domain-containing protein [Phlyctochytrium arcticum]